MKARIIVLSLISAALAAGYGITCLAQADSQGSATILPSLSFSVPNNFSFPPTFIPETGEITTYKILDPSVDGDKLVISEYDNTSGFSVTVSMTDLTPTPASDKVIRFTNMGLVTLSASATEAADGNPANTPPGAPNVIAPGNCNWSSSDSTDAETACAPLLDMPQYKFSEDGISATSILSDPASPGDAIITVVDASAFPVPGATPFKIKIDDDIISYAGINGNQLMGVSGIDDPHSAGTIVTEYKTISGQITIMEDNVPADRGTYSVGFVFSLKITAAEVPANYTGTILFTIYSP